MMQSANKEFSKSRAYVQSEKGEPWGAVSLKFKPVQKYVAKMGKFQGKHYSDLIDQFHSRLYGTEIYGKNTVMLFPVL